MQSRARDRHVVWIACCVLLAAACRSSAGEGAAGEPTPQRQAAHTLDLANPTAVQPIPPELAEPQRRKFVEVELTEIHNPKLVPIAFEVRYRRAPGDEILLGGFSPFPPDNPGRFLVATAGQLRPEGVIAVSLVVLRGAAPSDAIRVTLRISLRDE